MGLPNRRGIGCAFGPQRRCRSCKRHQRNAGFRIIHNQVEAMCGECYVRFRLSRDKGSLRAAMRRRWAQAQSSAQSAGVDWQMSKADFVALWQQPCMFCLEPIGTIGMYRVDKTRPFAIDNTVPCCRKCNQKLIRQAG
jgi:hypothetical protein